MVVRQNSLFLKECLHSLKAQTFDDWELIAVLDRDAGNNQNLIESVLGARKITILHDDFTRSGLSRMLNSGLSKCLGKYVARMDDDDICYPGRLLSQTSFLKDNPSVTVCFGAADLVSATGMLIGEIRPNFDPIRFEKKLIRKNVIVNSSSMFVKESILKVGGYVEDVNPIEDYVLWLRLLSFSKFHYLDEKMVKYRIHGSGISRTRLSPRIVRFLYHERKLTATNLRYKYCYSEYCHSMWWFEYRLGRYVHAFRSFKMRNNA
jgi:glycosyltransferase involved in cell wall biosynthesis